MLKQSINYQVKQALLPTVSLFMSLSTLVCCALPALFVTLGAGAALAGLVSTAPWLVALSKYKIWTFAISGAMILLAGFVRWKSHSMACPIDPEQAKACNRLRVISQWMYWLSVVIWCIGFFFAFLAVHILY